MFKEATFRQLFHRAKAHVAEHCLRFEASREEYQQMLERFMQACLLGDLDGLTALLTEDVVMTADGGGKASTATHPLHETNTVARFWIGLMRRLTGAVGAEVLEINGRPALFIRAGDSGRFADFV